MIMQQNGSQTLGTEDMFTQQNENSQNGTPAESREYIKNHWIKQEIELFPEEQIWTKRNISCFINGLDNFKKNLEELLFSFLEMNQVFIFLFMFLLQFRFTF